MGVIVMWVCAACGQPIPGDTGYVGVDYEGLATDDGPVTWTAWHDSCRPDDLAYSVGVSHLRTSPQVLRWTEHLSGKNWYARSDWAAVMAAHGIDVTPALVPEMDPDSEIARMLNDIPGAEL